MSETKYKHWLNGDFLLNLAENNTAENWAYTTEDRITNAKKITKEIV